MMWPFIAVNEGGSVSHLIHDTWGPTDEIRTFQLDIFPVNVGMPVETPEVLDIFLGYMIGL